MQLRPRGRSSWGLRRDARRGTATYCDSAPSRSKPTKAITGSPMARSSASEAVAATIPATSCPGTAGHVSGQSSSPEVIAAARTATRISPGSGVGTGRETMLRDSELLDAAISTDIVSGMGSGMGIALRSRVQGTIASRLRGRMGSHARHSP